MKYRDQTFLAKKFARILFEKSQEEISDCDLLVAVPLHFKRLRKRKFNQAVLLGKNILKQARLINENIEFYPDLLLRNKYTRAQVELKKKEREKNLRRVFSVKEKYCDLLKGKKILLLDDVATTGATLDNCAKELKRNGAKEVVAVTIAKTVLN